MTKEETIDMIIDDYKNGNQSAMSDYCDRTKCGECPLLTYVPCEHGIIEWLIDRLVKAEESQKAETSLEHYASYYNNYDQCIYMDSVRLYNEAHRRLNNFEEAIEWLLEPYKPPKPKYKLTQFEYDLLDSANPTWAHENDNTELCDFGYLTRLIDKGYFKDVPTDIPIGDILDNAEVINE